MRPRVDVAAQWVRSAGGARDRLAIRPTIWQPYMTYSFAEMFDPQLSTTAPYLTTTNTIDPTLIPTSNGNIQLLMTMFMTTFLKSKPQTYK